MGKTYTHAEVIYTNFREIVASLNLIRGCIAQRSCFKKMENHAIGMGTYSVVSNLLRQGVVKIIPMRHDFMQTHYGIVQLTNHTLSPAATEFIRILNQVEKELCDDEANYFDIFSG